MSDIEKDGVDAGAASKGSPASVYMENYQILADAAEELRDQEVVDIDRLIPVVDRALAAYAACKARIDAVDSLLKEKLGDFEE